jgi:hypothetical protein
MADSSNEQACAEEKKCPEGMVRKGGKCVMPDVTFTTFVLSLNTTALYHLGEIDDPATGKRNTDLMMAKHAIDTLKLLQQKTTGNLTDDEKNLLDNILCDLKLRYVKLSD